MNWSLFDSNEQTVQLSKTKLIIFVNCVTESNWKLIIYEVEMK